MLAASGYTNCNDIILTAPTGGNYDALIVVYDESTMNIRWGITWNRYVGLNGLAISTDGRFLIVHDWANNAHL